MRWTAYPIANQGMDWASRIVLRDMSRWGVKTDFIIRSRKTITPIVIEKLSNNGRDVTHEFKFSCPVCGSPLPRNRPVSAKLVSGIIRKMPAAQTFYFDRISRTAIELAREQRSRGALIVFEPSKFNKGRLFQECLAVAHIVKYSRTQIDISGFQNEIPLEIQTLGAQGLRYRMKGVGKAFARWKELRAFHVEELVDSAGAGDWCTAGIIHMLGQRGADGFQDASEDEIETALNFGEILAALKCGYEGARGLMYNLTKVELESQVCELMGGGNLEKQMPLVSNANERQRLQFICAGCERVNRKGEIVSISL